MRSWGMRPQPCHATLPTHVLRDSSAHLEIKRISLPKALFDLGDSLLWGRVSLKLGTRSPEVGEAYLPA